jgi:hypothetical protein
MDKVQFPNGRIGGDGLADAAHPSQAVTLSASRLAHTVTVAVRSVGTAAVLAACHHYLGPVGLTYLRDAIAGWVVVHRGDEAITTISVICPGAPDAFLP